MMKKFIVEVIHDQRFDKGILSVILSDVEYQTAVIKFDKIYEGVKNDPDLKITYWDSTTLIVELMKNSQGVVNPGVTTKYQII
jgi:hypothetical protein